MISTILALSETSCTIPYERVRENIIEIVTLCNARYSDEINQGNTALNRSILLDKNIARLLTPEVLLYLLCKPDGRFRPKLQRNSKRYTHEGTYGDTSYGVVYNNRFLADVIKNGFSRGLEVLAFMPNNTKDYNYESYLRQIECYEHNTQHIINNLEEALSLIGIKSSHKVNLPDHNIVDIAAIKEGYIKILQIIEGLTEDERNALVTIPGFSKDDILSQLDYGLNKLINMVGESIDDLDTFCISALSSPEFFFNPDVSHLFFDRLHLEAALISSNLVKIANKEYTPREVVDGFIKNIEHSKVHPAIKKQWELRVGLINSDLTEKTSLRKSYSPKMV